jgi:hypothetical protein
MKRFTFLLLLIPLLLLSGCKGKGIKDISVTSVRLISITPEGFNGVSALIEVGIHNPTIGFEVTNLTGVAKFQGQDALSVHADQLMVPGHSDALYRIPLQGSIADGFNPLRLLRLLSKDGSYEDVTFDVYARVAARGGLGKNIEILDIPLSSMLSKPQPENDEITTTE